VVEFGEVAQFVNNDIVGEVWWEVEKSIVEIEVPLL
jgi:hypothetical protein